MLTEVTEPPLSPETPRRIPHLSRIVTSFAWLVTETISARIVAFLSQLVLAYLLVREDFGLFVQTNLVRSLADLIATPGFRILLIQRHAEFNRIATPVFWLSAILGLLCSAIIVVVAFLSEAVESPIALAMILIVASSVPFRALSVLPEAALRIRMQFAEIAFLGLLAVLLTAVISIVLAYMGFGALSLVIPFPIVAIVQLFIAWWLTRPKVAFLFSLKDCGEVIQSTSILFASRLLTFFSANVDYFFLLMFHSKEVVGLYFLAFNMSTQTIRLFSDTLVQVLMPAMAHTSEVEKQSRISLRATRMIALIVIPGCVLLAVLAPQVVALCFRPEYLGMIPMLQVLCLGMAFRCVGAISNALLNAQGRFGTVLWFDATTTILFGVSVGLAAWLGTAVHVAVVVGVNVIVRMVLLQRASLRNSQIAISEAVGSYMYPAFVSLLSGVATQVLYHSLAVHISGDLGALIVKGCLFCVLYLSLASITMKKDVKATFGWIGSLWHKIFHWTFEGKFPKSHQSRISERGPGSES
jgi:PST family polysaccharide transporter